MVIFLGKYNLIFIEKIKKAQCVYAVVCDATVEMFVRRRSRHEDAGQTRPTSYAAQLTFCRLKCRFVCFVHIKQIGISFQNIHDYLFIEYLFEKAEI